MALAMSLLLLAILCSLSVGFGEWTFVDTDSEEESDNPECLCGGVERPCHSLEYIAEQASRLTTSCKPTRISITGHTANIWKSVNFTNVRDIILKGNGTQVVCHEAGFVFHSVENLHITHLEICNCGIHYRDYFAAIHVRRCRNVKMQDIAVLKGAVYNASSIIFSDTFGEVLVQNTLFQGNDSGKGRSVLIEFTSSEPSHLQRMHTFNTKYVFKDCSFVNSVDNAVSGGGLCLLFDGASCLTVSIKNCKFVGNHARWAGGLFICFGNGSYNNSVIVSDTIFQNNSAGRAGGGAGVGYSGFYHTSPFNNNSILFQDSTFIENRAMYGGGTAIFSSHGLVPSNHGDTVNFVNCTWKYNFAPFSPAVDVSPITTDTLSNGFLPVPVFEDCQFISNIIEHKRQSCGTKHINAGSFVITTFTVHFGGQITFFNHTYSALHVVSGTIVFHAGAQVLFLNNTGIQGGAIALYGFSSLQLHNDSYFEFTNNSATDVGGAIYFHSFDQHDFVSTHACFIQYVGPQDIEERNLSLTFTGNSAKHSGDSIFALSFYPCFFELINSYKKSINISEIFHHIGEFRFEPSNNKTIGSAGARVEPTDGNKLPIQLKVIPGKRVVLPLVMKDELNNLVFTVYQVNGKGLDSDRSYTANRRVCLYGKPESNGTLDLNVLSFREFSINLQVAFLQCPPGYFFDEFKRRCVCAAYFEKHAYPGIGKCNSSLFRAYIIRGVWAGYLKENNSDLQLYTAPCPLGFCKCEYNSSSLKFHLLPESHSDLDDFMCGCDRTGVLCGECRDGLSVYYHSRRYKCGESGQCHLGFLWYFMSELLPLTIVFTIIVVFDISFTSGTVNGFIFFSQVLDSLAVDAKGIIHFPSAVNKLSAGYNIIYGLFNLDFFSTDYLSFCLWKQATVLDVLAFKYITTVFAFALVMCLVHIMKHCSCRRVCTLKKRMNTGNSVIHGLSAFLIMCYAQCTKVSFQILIPVVLKGEGGQPGSKVTLFGGMSYFEGKHLLYVVPAYICLATIVAIPPILLLVYPLCLQVLALCGLSENKTINRIFQIIPVLKLKPLLDSFQGCFKDKLRFFAGL